MPLAPSWWLAGLVVGLAGLLWVRWSIQRAEGQARQASLQILDRARQAGTKS